MTMARSRKSRTVASPFPFGRCGRGVAMPLSASYGSPLEGNLVSYAVIVQWRYE